MAKDRRTAFWETITGAGLAVVGAAFLVEGWDLPDGFFEPMGPRPVPLALAWFIVAGSIWMFATGAVSLIRGTALANEDPGYPELPWAAFGTAAAVVVYCAVLSFGVMPYWLATALYLMFNIPFLAENRRRIVINAVIVGILLGGGLHLIFTRLLVTDLP
jgi:hypothetical protein